RRVGTTPLTAERISDNMIVVFETGDAVQSRVDPRQVVTLGCILDRELPVGGKRDFEGRPAGIAREPRQIVGPPTLFQGFDEFLERYGCAGNIDKDQIMPDGSTYRSQSSLSGIESVDLILARPAN